MTTSIGFVIQPGQPIPDDVTEVRDRSNAPHELDGEGRWHQGGIGLDRHPWDADELTEWGPLTVTAVREQPGKPCWKCGLTVGEIVDRGAGAFADGRLRFMHAYGECPTADQLAQHTAEGIAEPLNINGLIRDSREIMALLGVTEPADVLPELTRRLAAPEPQQADASPVLDLVRQYGDEIGGVVSAGECAGPDEVHQHQQAADALLDRIAALAPQQPVRARTTSGDLLWQHIPCGWASPWHPESKPDTGPDGDPVGCHKPGPWRPLLVGGDPTPETYDEQTLFKVYDALKHAGLSEVHSFNAVNEMQNLGLLFRERANPVPKQPSAPDNPAPRPAVVEAWKVALAERDAARAELEHLNIAVSQEIETRDENAEWADRLANAIAAHLGVDIGEHSNSNLPWQAALLALEFTAPPQPDPLKLSLPKVPEGTVALVDRLGTRWVLSATQRERWLVAGGNGLTEPFHYLMWKYGPLTPELATPREPRTWSKLDPVPDDLRHVRGASGTVYVRSGGTCAFSGYRNGESVTRSLHALREEDGPLDEVLK